MSSSHADKHIFKSASKTLEVIKSLWPDFYCTIDNLKHPTFDFLMRFIINFLKDFDLINEDILKVGKKWEMNNAEAISDISEIMVIYKPFDFVLRKINFKDFKLLDLITPSNKTAMTMIKSVLNLLLFRCQLNEKIEPQMYEIDKKRSLYEDILKCISNYEQIIEEFHNNETDHNHQLTKLKELTINLEAENKDIITTLNHLTEKIKLAELTNQKKQKQVNELQQQIDRLKFEESKLTDQIVENSTQLQEKYDNISKLKSELKEKQHQQKELLTSHHNLISICESIINKYKDLLSDCKLLYLATEKYTKSLKLSTEIGQDEIKNNLQIQQIHEEILSAMTLLETSENTGKQQLIISEEKKKKIESELIPLQLELESAKKQQKKLKTNYDKILEEIAISNTASAQYQKNYKTVIKFYEESYNNLTKKVAAMDQYAIDEFSKLLKFE